MTAAPGGWRGRVAGSFKWHLLAFLAANGGLTAANVTLGRPWWAVWPLAATGALLAIHYFFAKAFAADERWVAERVQELNLKSYDRSHIEDIKTRHAAAKAAGAPLRPPDEAERREKGG